MHDKSTIRLAIKAQRAALPKRDQQKLSQSICQKVLNLDAYKTSQHIALYLANQNEVDVQILLDDALAQGKQCFLPVLNPLKHNELWFVPYYKDDPLTANCYNIMEPFARLSDKVPAKTLDLVLTPLLAFDDQLNRLGMGGGYYDRSFSFLLKQNEYSTKLLGVAYEFQKVDKLEAELWDVPLDMIITESSCFCRTNHKN